MPPRDIEADVRQLEHEVAKVRGDVAGLAWSVSLVSAAVVAMWFFFMRR
jgi:hypothetical protein